MKPTTQFSLADNHVQMKNSLTILFVALGAAFWLIGAMIVRLLGQTVFSENNPYLILMFVLAIPITFGFIFITRKVAKLEQSEILRPVVIITYTATFLDAIAMTWFRNLYSSSFEVSFFGAAFILWGAGNGLFLAHFLTNKNNNIASPN
ncbi:hypothetical protein DSM106972_086410 [Dulcicalothrix desertica PCC 7102]|uniref:DUF5367 domain-containing protein n=1 Tax=Dulcicalothrix desertica PCC 7102 TaxID=232991 RepID=A0A3S1IFG9_9CYAN|nr:DUF5367 family protein [Dulcicalothrix desertica]RUS96618.1 hypothetical protein DSM106972_086410 [Dulcicalothrix desertica PCC 7102]TWH43870.1 hypothetical protein CAL7102_07618 [Dulcicalothrix desertica PCC 7102]